MFILLGWTFRRHRLDGKSNFEPLGAVSQDERQSDEDLVFAIAGGDRDALGALYDRHHGAVAAVARRFGVGGGELEELVHDIFLELWGAAGEFDPERGKVLTWLLVRTRSRAIDSKRKNARRQELLDTSGDLLHPSDPGVDPVKSMIRQQVRAAVEQLDDELRKVVDLAYYAGDSTRAMAESLGIPRGTVKSRLRRAREALAVVLTDVGGRS